MHLVVVLIEVRSHRRPAHPHHLEDVLGEKDPDGDGWDQEAKHAEAQTERVWDGGV